MKALAEKIRLPARHRPDVKPGRIAQTQSVPPRVKPGHPAPKSLFQRVAVAMTPQRWIDRERRAQNFAFVLAKKARSDAVQGAIKEADGAMTDLVNAVKTGNLAGLKSASAKFEEVLAPFSKQTGQRQNATRDEGLDAAQLRGNMLFRLVEALSKDTTGSTDLTRLQTLHKQLETLPKDSLEAPLIFHLSMAVKAELLHHAMARVSLDQVRKEKDGHLRAQGLKELSDMGDAARDISKLMKSDTFPKTENGGESAIPGTSLTRDQLIAAIRPAETATAMRTADKLSTLDLSAVSLRDLLLSRKEIGPLRENTDLSVQERDLYQTLYQNLSAAITLRRQQISAANRTIGQPFIGFKRSLESALQVNEKWLPTKLLAHAVKAEEAMATLENKGASLSQKQRMQWIKKALKGADQDDLNRLQISLHFGACKWMLYDLSSRRTERAAAAFQHLSMVKEALTALMPNPQPPQSPMLLDKWTQDAVSNAFKDHPYPSDEDMGLGQGGHPISPKVMAAMVSLTQGDVSSQVLAALRGVRFGKLVQALAQRPGQLAVLNLALDKLSTHKAKNPLIAQLSLAVKCQLLAKARSRTASFTDVMKEEDAETRSEGLIALMGLSEIAHQVLNLRLEVDPSDKVPVDGEDVFPGIPLTMVAARDTLRAATFAHRQRIEDAVSLVESVKVADLSKISAADLQHASQEIEWLLETSDGQPEINKPVLDRVAAQIQKRF